MSANPDFGISPRALRVPTLVSVVAPMMNEEETLTTFCERTCAALAGYRFELVLVDDGSSDATASMLQSIADADPRVRAVFLSRNFGHQAALMAGLEAARGDVVVTIDADLQDPPELIPALIDHWRSGSDVVHAVRRIRHGEPRWKVRAKRSFYRMFSRLSNINYLSDAGDFRLFDRLALDAVLQMRERHRFVRGMAVWVGYTQTAVPYDRDARYAGSTKYPLRKLLGLGVDGIVSFSNVPLQLATIVGGAVSVIALLLIPGIVVLRSTGHYIPGVASIHILILLLGGVQLITLGIVGVYVGRVLDEVKARPTYLVRPGPPDAGAPAPQEINGSSDILVDLRPSEAAAAALRAAPLDSSE